MPIIINTMFPSSESKKRPSETIQEVNRLVAAAMKGDPQVVLLDTFTLFADENGDARADLFPDLLHLNPEGYAAWAGALRPLLATLGYVETEADDFEVEEGFESLFNGENLTGWGFRVTPPRRKPKKPRPDASVWVEISEPESYRPQDWNELEVAVTGRTARANCNGELLEEEWPVPETGPIGLEGDRGQIEYRRIRIKENK